MRTYKRNSPHAAARIVAISLLADGHLGCEEIIALERLQLSQRLGMSADEFEKVIRELCEDLMMTPHLNWGDTCRPNSEIMRHVISELADARLRSEVMSLCQTAVHADNHVSAGESAFLLALSHAWQLPAGIAPAHSRQVAVPATCR